MRRNFFEGELPIAQDREVRVNGEINAPEVRLVGIKGEQIGIVPIEKAQALAEEQEIDLVEIAPTAKPPVCRLMDFGKYKYNEAKKRHEAKLKQKDRKSTRLNSSHSRASRMPSSA